MVMRLTICFLIGFGTHSTEGKTDLELETWTKPHGKGVIGTKGGVNTAVYLSLTKHQAALKHVCLPPDKCRFQVYSDTLPLLVNSDEQRFMAVQGPQYK